jgi:hypothetical protein
MRPIGFHDGYLKVDANRYRFACSVALSIVTVLRDKGHLASVPVLSTRRRARPALAEKLAGSNSLYISWITGTFARNVP